MIKLKVLYFNGDKLSSRCRVLQSDTNEHYVGQEFYVDLTVNGDFQEQPESFLVGKTVTLQGLQPHEYLGIDVKIVDD